MKIWDIDWAAVPDLGQVSDGAVAERIGCTRRTVCTARNELGIAPYVRPRPNWSKIEDWDTASDEEIAARMGCHKQSVSRRRRELGLPRPDSGWFVDWSQAKGMWGKATDREIAAHLGCTEPAVVYHRKKHGILSSMASLPRCECCGQLLPKDQRGTT